MLGRPVNGIPPCVATYVMLYENSGFCVSLFVNAFEIKLKLVVMNLIIIIITLICIS